MPYSRFAGIARSGCFVRTNYDTARPFAMRLSFAVPARHERCASQDAGLAFRGCSDIPLSGEIAMPDGAATIAQSPEDLRAKINEQITEGKPAFFKLEAQLPAQGRTDTP